MATRIVLKNGVTFDIKSSSYELIRYEQGRVVNIKIQNVDQRKNPLYTDFSEIAAVFDIGSESSGG